MKKENQKIGNNRERIIQEKWGVLEAYKLQVQAGLVTWLYKQQRKVQSSNKKGSYHHHLHSCITKSKPKLFIYLIKFQDHPQLF